jgi:aarF domain-containing kinase
MVEMQKLCDKVPSFDNDLAMATIEDEFGKPVSDVFSEISPAPVAAASLGQVYKARLRSTGELVAVKVQRPFVLETVSLDLYLLRKFGKFLRNFEYLRQRTDLVALLDEFASRFYEELDYRLECQNGIKIRESMRCIPQVLVPRNFPELTTRYATSISCALAYLCVLRRVFVTEWVDGEKLSQSTADDVQELVNVGVVAYLTQLLDSGFFHADPHPGNLIRTPDGKLALIDFGLMTNITEDQRYGMIEAIAHLVHRDYSAIGDDFRKLDFIPEGVDLTPIVPALSRVFDAALAGGGAKSINFQDLAADLAEITFKYPFRIPPYFALIIRAIGVLEGIALVGNPNFAIVDEAYPYISKRLLTDEHPRLKAALKYMIYGKEGVFDVERLIDLLKAFENFATVTQSSSALVVKPSKPTVELPVTKSQGSQDVREALKFLFSSGGAVFREFMTDEIVKGVDALSRDALYTVMSTLQVREVRLPGLVRAMAPRLSEQDRKVVRNLNKLVSFLTIEDVFDSKTGTPALAFFSNPMRIPSPFSVLNPFSNLPRTLRPPRDSAEVLADVLGVSREKAKSLLPTLREFAPAIRQFGREVIAKLVDRTTSRALRYASDVIFGDAK